MCIVLTGSTRGSCGADCHLCADLFDRCTSCRPGFRLSAGRCLRCGEGCTNCEGPAGECLACFEGFFLRSLSEENFSCSPCGKGCSSCSDGRLCLSCASRGEVVSADSSRCESCTDHCLVCDSGDKCSECQTGFSLSDAHCLKSTWKYLVVFGVAFLCCVGSVLLFVWSRMRKRLRRTAATVVFDLQSGATVVNHLPKSEERDERLQSGVGPNASPESVRWLDSRPASGKQLRRKPHLTDGPHGAHQQQQAAPPLPDLKDRVRTPVVLQNPGSMQAANRFNRPSRHAGVEVVHHKQTTATVDMPPVGQSKVVPLKAKICLKQSEQAGEHPKD